MRVRRKSSTEEVTARVQAVGLRRRVPGRSTPPLAQQEAAPQARAGLQALGFRLLPGEHPIVPVMLGDAVLAQRMAAALGARGVHVAGFFFPVVPKGQARIRTQMNARLTRADLDFALSAFAEAGRETGVL